MACGTVRAAPSGPLQPIREGFGADGPYEVRVDTVPCRFILHRTVYVFRPAVEDTTFPVVFFFPGFGAWHPANYEPLLRHLASRGFCVIFPSYLMVQFPMQGRTFKLIYAGALAAAHAHAAHIDTTRIGFAGHSFAASALPGFAYRLITRRGWGRNGAFMFLMAPFYLFSCPPHVLAHYPPQMKLIVQLYEDDDCNDHRMGKDLFEAIAIPPENKAYMVLRSDTCPATGYVLKTNHSTPCGPGDPEGVEDGLDYYGVYRPLDALAQYAFTGDSLAGVIALGDGDSVQTYVGTWGNGEPVRPSIVSGQAPLLRPSSQFYFHWKHPWNLRRRWCRVKLDDPWEK